jgi:hypothetical protein
LMSELETVSHRPYGTGFFFGLAGQDPSLGAYLQTHDWVAEVSAPPASHILPPSPASPASPTLPLSPTPPASQTEGQRVHVVCRNRFYEGDSLELLSPHQDTRPIVVRALRREFCAQEDRGCAFGEGCGNGDAPPDAVGQCDASAPPAVEGSYGGRALPDAVLSCGSAAPPTSVGSCDASALPAVEGSCGVRALPDAERSCGDRALPASERTFEEVTVANQAMEHYSFVPEPPLDTPLAPHDILRVRRRDPARKN